MDDLSRGMLGEGQRVVLRSAKEESAEEEQTLELKGSRVAQDPCAHNKLRI